jgi:ATP-binding cassette subfamily C (CFTR/MRP) protein 1
MVAPFVFVGTLVYAANVVAVDRSNREAKRMSNAAMAPILSTIAECVNGRTQLRVMAESDFMSRRFNSRVDEFSRQNFFSGSVINWGMFLSYMISSVVSSLTAIFIFLHKDEYSAAFVGLALTYSFLVPYFLLHYSFIISMFKMGLTSLERLLEYKGPAVPQELDWYKKTDPKLNLELVDTTVDIAEAGGASGAGGAGGASGASGAGGAGGASGASGAGGAGGARSAKANGANVLWPSVGTVVFEDVSLIYRPGLPPAVRNVSFVLPGGTRTGVVGRTGAGKSSLVVLLFRICEPSTGRLLIDGRDTAGLGLQTLRKSMSVIPQQPLLMKGSVKHNLDPFELHSDDALAAVLRRVGLLANSGEYSSGTESEGGLEEKDAMEVLNRQVAGGGEAVGLSAGQQQLLSFARTLLSPAKIVVMDEPTSNIDFKTDASIQDVVRTTFKEQNRTVITIAHRLNTIIDFEQILVMSEGRLIEQGEPVHLLDDPSTELHAMANALGESAACQLHEKAERAALERRAGQGNSTGAGVYGD